LEKTSKIIKSTIKRHSSGRILLTWMFRVLFSAVMLIPCLGLAGEPAPPALGCGGEGKPARLNQP